MERSYDFDWLVIGSGFGGSVSALRLSEKGYSVGVLECGRRFEDEDFAEKTLELNRYYWLPRLGMKGILRLTIFKDIFVASGCGVGGGSLGYANTLYQPKADSMFYRDPQWAHMTDWYETLDPHYREAERMLGVTTCELPEGPADTLLKELAGELGVSDTYSKTRVGVYFGEPGKTVPDPYFGGEGPDRTGCIACGSCMVGCRYNAKNTLMKNYLWFAERNGVKIMPERTVVEVRPLSSDDGSDGYSVTSERSGSWFRKDRQTLTARGVVVAAGPLGTNQLLRRCKDRGALPRLSDRLGYLVRSNSEAITAVTTKNDRLDFTKSIAITSSIYPSPDTHIENVTYGRGADTVGLLFTIFTGPGSRLTRPLRALARSLLHPIEWVRANSPWKWSRRTIILLTMQTLDNSIRLKPKRNLMGLGPRLQTEEDADKPNPRFIEVANWATRRAAEKLDATPQTGSSEAWLNIPTTAHIMGGAAIGESPETGVIDAHQRAFGYENLLVCDGSAIPANIGVNPSLTITALAEHAMSHVPARNEEAAPETEATETSKTKADDVPVP
jgi:cholesterol oxidase